MDYPKGIDIVLVLYTVKGSGYLVCGDKRHTLSEGTIAFVPTHTAIQYGTDPNGSGTWEFYWLNLSGSYVEDTAHKLWEDGFTCHICRDRNQYTQIMCSLLEDSSEAFRQEQIHTNAVTALLDLLLGEILFDSNNDIPNTDPRADRLLAYLQAQYADPICLDDLSKHFFLSVNQVIRIFRTRTGYAPYEYLKRYRLTKACEFLEGTDLQVRDIAHKVGYTNSAHFTAQFRSFYGITPTQYRTGFSPQE